MEVVRAFHSLSLWASSLAVRCFVRLRWWRCTKAVLEFKKDRLSASMRKTIAEQKNKSKK